MTTGMQIEDRILVAIRRIIRAIDLYSRKLVEEHGLSGPQLLTLQQVERLEPVAAGVLARSVHLSQATLTGILDRLERRGWIARARDTEDRRSVIISLTDQGRTLLRHCPSALQDRFRQQLSRLRDWEQNMMLAVLQRIALMMEADTLDAAPLLVTGPLGPGTGRPGNDRLPTDTGVVDPELPPVGQAGPADHPDPAPAA